MVDDDSDTVLSSGEQLLEAEQSGDTILAAAPPPPAPTLTPALKLTDFIPILRPEIDIEPQDDGSTLLIDSETNRSVRLSALETRIARLLDGKRRVSKLIEMVGALGIPFTLQSLQTLIAKFEELDLLVGRRRKRLPIASPNHGAQFDQTVRQPVPADKIVTHSDDLGTRATEPVDAVAELPRVEHRTPPPVRVPTLRPVLTGVALAVIVLALLYVTLGRR